jgi:hypothetical protein
MKKLLLFLCVCCVFTSCSNEHNLEIDTNVSIKNDLLINKQKVEIAESDAEKVALLFKNVSRNTSYSRAVEIERPSIQTITDSKNGTPLLYIVNMANDKGYVVISANKKSKPIWAFAETGHLNLNSSNATTAYAYIDAYKAEILNNTQNYSISDSLRKAHAVEWAVFEKSDQVLDTSTRTSSETDALIQKEIETKEALGYTYIGRLSALSYYVPNEKYQATVEAISSHTDSRYNYEDVSLFFIKSYNYEQIGHLMNTEWHQHEPFNVYAPNEKAGCFPIAIAQIAYFHKFPSKYNWNEIYPNPVLNNSFINFILDIRNYCNVEYNKDATSTSKEDALKALCHLGYNVQKMGIPDNEKLRNEIKAYSPCILCGENEHSKHAWVCEGYVHKQYQAVISMIADKRSAIPNENSLYSDYELFINSPSEANDTSDREYFI